MKGFYFINTDIANTRAHTCQMLNTVESIDVNLSLDVVTPKYHKEVDFEAIRQRHGLLKTPRAVLLRNFGVNNSGIIAFALFNIPASLFLLNKKIKKEVNFIYIRSSFLLPLVIFAYILRIPVFYETHRKPLSKSEQRRDYLISKVSKGIIVISKHMREHYLPYKKKILVVHDAASLKRFTLDVDKNEARKKLDLPLDKKICIYTGTVSKLKGLDYVFDTARTLPEVLFILVGQVSPEFKGIDLPLNVRLLGKKDQKELPLMLQTADILLLPHPKGEYSQSPMKLFEYMASQVPIVASRLPSITEVLNDTNSVLVEPEDVQALASGIERVVNDINLSKNIAQKAYNDVQDYTWGKRGNKIAKFINTIMLNK